MIRFRTASGSLYELDADTLTRLAEKPMRNGRGAQVLTVLHRAPCDVVAGPTIGSGFRAVVDGIPLHTTPVTEVLEGAPS